MFYSVLSVSSSTKRTHVNPTNAPCLSLHLRRLRRRSSNRVPDVKEDDGICSSYAKSIVLGGIDGCMAVLAVICACEAGNLGWETVVIIAISVVFANSLYIGTGEYLSSKAHRQFIMTERRRVLWEFKHNPSHKKKIMSDLFEAKGMTKSDADQITRKMAQYESFFVDLMLMEETQLCLPDDDDASLLYDSFVMFMAFAGFGCLPVLTYVLIPMGVIDREVALPISFVSVSVLLFFLGGLKSTFSNVVWAYSSFEVLVMGLVSGGLSYFVSYSVASSLN
jgi:vacuolar iron transporter family protein